MQDFNHTINTEAVAILANEGAWPLAFEALAEPLHAALLTAGDFAYLESCTPVERLVLSLDYVQSQVLAGGFIQFFQNGYAPLLAIAIESLQTLDSGAHASLAMDDALKIFVLNHEALSRETSLEGFAKLYNEFQEFSIPERDFLAALPELYRKIVAHVLG